MGVGLKATLYFFEMLQVAGITDLAKVSVCVLGDQRIKVERDPDHRYNHKTFRKMLLNNGVAEAISIDLNGNDGSIVTDLSRPLPVSLHQKFNVVFDAGTSEHIMSDQWQLFKNVFELLTPTGLSIHILPKETRGHGFYGYPEDFFRWLEKACQYRVLDTRITSVRYKSTSGKHYTFATLQKTPNSVFVNRKQWRDPDRDLRGFERFSQGYPTFVDQRLKVAGNA